METRSTAALILALLAIAASPARGATVTWNNAGDDWFDDLSWDSGNHPGAGDHAVITNGTVLLTNVTDQLASLTMSGGTLTFSNWTTRLRATDVTISGGTVSCAGPFNSYTNYVWPAYEGSNRVAITCSNLTIA